MSELLMTNEQIKDLIEAFKNADLGELSISQGDFKIKINSQKQMAVASTYEVMQTPMPIANPQINTMVDNSTVVTENVVEEKATAVEGKEVKSPIVGTYYSAPAPDKEPFVSVGQRVKKGDVLFIIESMKLMNEIQSEVDGEVTAILLETGSPVEYDQPVLMIK